MRIHSDIITRADLAEALKAACAQQGGAIEFVTLAEHRSTKRGRAYEVKLGTDVKVKGDKRRRPNDGQYGAGQGWAATRDEWGEFLAYLFDEVDPNAIVAGVYADGYDFHEKTRDAYGQ